MLKDPSWTKEETDYLFNLVREYDGRFYVVHDRYEYPGGIERTLEVSIFAEARIKNESELVLVGPERSVLQCMSETGPKPSMARR